MDSIRSQLKDMGFSEAKVDRALSSCPDAQTLEQVMEWLIAHESDLNNDDPGASAQVGDTKLDGKLEPTSVGDSTSDDQGKEPANESAASMATRKKITVEEAQRLIQERQAKRAEEERKKAIEDERKRRLDGQKMAETRAELQDQERIREAQQYRREKREEELHRQRVLEQIARDREAMKLKSMGATSSSAEKSISAKSQPPKVSSTECRLALRFPDGTNLVHKFSPQEQLAAVRLFVQMEKTSAATTGVEFVAPPNKKLAESDMNSTLENLGLCPASRLEVKFNQSTWHDLD